MKQGIIYRKTDGPFRYQAWPSVCIDENGVLYAVCSGHRVAHVCPFGKNLMFISCDGGDTWSPPIIVNDTRLDDRDAGITYLGKGKMLLSYFCHDKDNYIYRHDRPEIDYYFNRHCAEEYRPMAKAALEAYHSFTPEMNTYGSFLRLSEDYGFTWSEPIKVPVTAPHGPVMTLDGRLLYLGKSFGMINNKEPSEYPIQLWESFDNGKSWEKVSDLPNPEGVETGKLHEPHLAQLPDGRLVGAVRAHNTPDGFALSTYFTVSEDGGKTWSIPHSLGIDGTPPHLTLLPDGGLLCVYGQRTDPRSIHGVISYDAFQSISKHILLSHAPNTKYGSDLGYPASVVLPDGSVLTVYYHPYETDLHPSILYTKWRVEEAEDIAK